MKFTFYSDIHMHAPHATGDAIPFRIEQIERDNIWLIGDIIDLKGCDKKDKEACLKIFELVKSLYGKRYLRGNHDGDNTDPLFAVVGDVLLTHGDAVCWDKDKREKFRGMPKFQGYGWIKRFINWARHLWKQRISKFEVEQATMYCKHYGCNKIVYGHSHTKKLLIKEVNGITIYNVPQRVTELDL